MDAIQVVEHKVWVPKWKCQVTNLITQKGIYNSIPEICKILGVADARQQKDQLLERRATKRYVEELPFSTRRGKRPRWCIHQDSLQFWLGMINENRIREEFQDGLVEFQLDIMKATNKGLEELSKESRETGAGIIIHISEWLGASHEPIDTDDDGEDEE